MLGGVIRGCPHPSSMDGVGGDGGCGPGRAGSQGQVGGRGLGGGTGHHRGCGRGGCGQGGCGRGGCGAGTARARPPAPPCPSGLGRRSPCGGLRDAAPGHDRAPHHPQPPVLPPVLPPVRPFRCAASAAPRGGAAAAPGAHKAPGPGPRGRTKAGGGARGSATPGGRGGRSRRQSPAQRRHRAGRGGAPPGAPRGTMGPPPPRTCRRSGPCRDTATTGGGRGAALPPTPTLTPPHPAGPVLGAVATSRPCRDRRHARPLCPPRAAGKGTGGAAATCRDTAAPSRYAHLSR